CHRIRRIFRLCHRPHQNNPHAMGWLIMLLGQRTWLFHNQPVIIATGTVGGPFEAQGNLKNDFDILHDDMWLKQKSFEKAQQLMLEEAYQIALKKGQVQQEQITSLLSGDLINKITPKTIQTKPPTAQWTVTGAGCGLIAKEGIGPVVTSATIGKVVDKGMTDPFNMGGAMAPAAVDTIIAHLKERNVDPSYYDLIITGDLGQIG